MTTRMYHPEHGWTHAYTAQEIEALKKQGWQVEEQKKPRRKDKDQK